jgi:hypothetical protein
MRHWRAATATIGTVFLSTARRVEGTAKVSAIESRRLSTPTGTVDRS